MAGYLHEETNMLLRKLMGKFVCTKAIKKYPSLLQVPFCDSDIQHPDDNISIGMKAREYIRLNEDMPDECLNAFFRYMYIGLCEHSQHLNCNT